MKKNLYKTPAVCIYKVNISSIMQESNPTPTNVTNEEEITTPEGMNAKQSISDSNCEETW